MLRAKLTELHKLLRMLLLQYNSQWELQFHRIIQMLKDSSKYQCQDSNPKKQIQQSSRILRHLQWSLDGLKIPKISSPTLDMLRIDSSNKTHSINNYLEVKVVKTSHRRNTKLSFLLALTGLIWRRSIKSKRRVFLSSSKESHRRHQRYLKNTEILSFLCTEIILGSIWLQLLAEGTLLEMYAQSCESMRSWNIGGLLILIVILN